MTSLAARALAVVAAVAMSGACGGARTGTTSAAFDALAQAPAHDRAAEERSLAAERAQEARRAPAPSHAIATIADRSIGPFAARDGDAGIIAWIVHSKLAVIPISGDGRPLAEAHVVASVPAETTSLVVRPAGGAGGGWLIAWSAVRDRGESLTVLAVDLGGAARGAPFDVQRTSNHVEWSDLLPTARGVVCAWAEETSSGDADILTLALDVDGKARGAVARVARGIDRWQAVSADGGVGLALATVDSGAGHASKAGKLSWLLLDADGRPKASAVAVATTPTVGGDVDVVPVADGWLFAWTDRTGEDARVMFATASASGRAQGPVPALNALGGSVLVGLASGPQGVAVAWEEPRGRAHATLTLHLARVSTAPALTAQPAPSLEIASNVAPDLVAIDGGFAVLASARACVADGAPRPCDGSPPVTTYVRLGPGLDAVQAEPIVLPGLKGGSAATALGWGLRCAKDSCFALAATGDAPARVFAVSLPPRTSPFAVPTLPAAAADAPRVTGIQTIASGKPFDDLAATRVGDATFVATMVRGLADDSPSPRGDRRPHGATISLRVLGDDGRPRGDANVLTSHAVSVGGVAMASGASIADGAAVVWVGRDGGDLHVHVTHIDRRGHRKSEVKLTSAAAGASSAAIAWAGDGWLVAWVDARDGRGEVYATKVDRNLQRVAREERVTNASGDPGDVALAVRGDGAWLAWSDSRESPTEGLADIYATTLSVRDAKPASDAVRVLATAHNSRSPALTPFTDGSGALLAWIEDPATGLEGAGAAFVARLDRGGQVIAAPVELPLSPTLRPTAIALARPSGTAGVRAIVVRASAAVVTLDALLLREDGAPAGEPAQLLDLDAPPPFDVALALTDGALYFDDVGAGTSVEERREHRVRRATLAWGAASPP